MDKGYWRYGSVRESRRNGCLKQPHSCARIISLMATSQTIHCYLVLLSIEYSLLCTFTWWWRTRICLYLFIVSLLILSFKCILPYYEFLYGSGQVLLILVTLEFTPIPGIQWVLNNKLMMNESICPLGIRKIWIERILYLTYSLFSPDLFPLYLLLVICRLYFKL